MSSRRSSSSAGPSPCPSRDHRNTLPPPPTSSAPSPPPRGEGKRLASLLAQELRGFFGVVREDHVGAGAADRQQRRHHDAVVVDPALLGGGLEHRVLARDVVGGHGHVELVA